MVFSLVSGKIYVVGVVVFYVICWYFVYFISGVLEVLCEYGLVKVWVVMSLVSRVMGSSVSVCEVMGLVRRCFGDEC